MSKNSICNTTPGVSITENIVSGFCERYLNELYFGGATTSLYWYPVTSWIVMGAISPVSVR